MKSALSVSLLTVLGTGVAAVLVVWLGHRIRRLVHRFQRRRRRVRLHAGSGGSLFEDKGPSQSGL